MSAQCSSCLAPIVWAFTEAGKRMPIDAASSPTGNLVLEEETAAGAIVLRVHVEHAFDVDGPRHTSHFATCPQADQHRRRSHRDNRNPPRART